MLRPEDITKDTPADDIADAVKAAADADDNDTVEALAAAAIENGIPFPVDDHGFAAMDAVDAEIEREDGETADLGL